jgi:hypothetical protein
MWCTVSAKDYEEAFNWYEKKSYVAADNFIIRVQEAISAISTRSEIRRRSIRNNQTANTASSMIV